MAAAVFVVRNSAGTRSDDGAACVGFDDVGWPSFVH